MFCCHIFCLYFFLSEVWQQSLCDIFLASCLNRRSRCGIPLFVSWVIVCVGVMINTNRIEAVYYVVESERSVRLLLSLCFESSPLFNWLHFRRVFSLLRWHTITHRSIYNKTFKMPSYCYKCRRIVLFFFLNIVIMTTLSDTEYLL